MMIKNAEETLHSIMGIESYTTKLDDQILFMETLNKLFTAPMTVSILNSLKELKGIKNKQLEKLITKNNE
jgi:hypothetical protein